MDGFLLLHKPVGITSFETLLIIKDLLPRATRVGHSGTLDAFASGLLIVAIGRPATSHIKSFLILDKIYTARAKWGQLTDTLDRTGKIISATDQIPNKKVLEEIIATFGALYKQTPPIYSALKIQGKRLSDIARSARNKLDLHQIAKNKSQNVYLYELTLLNVEDCFFQLRAHVSHGTYIRSLLNDIAQKAESYATTHELVREQIGPFTISQAHNLSDIRTQQDIFDRMISIEQMIRQLNEYNRAVCARNSENRLKLFKFKKHMS